MLLAIWYLGPRVVEQYYYAATNGRVRAEYKNAVALLKEQPLENVSMAFQLVAQKVRPSVVSIVTERRLGNRRGLHIADAGQGSGVIMSDQGYILTNAHVLTDATTIEIVLHDRRKFLASLVGIDDRSDLAVLKIDASGLIPAEWGNSDQLNVGSIVWAIGSPFGLDQTVTSGIVSGKNRRDDSRRNGGQIGGKAFHQELLQTDAAVNPGNSGGPLVDSQGRVVGINTSIIGEQFQGISFAVPSAIARFVYDQLIEHGRVTRGYLGVLPNMVFQDFAQKFELPDLKGAVIESVEPGSPAESAGLQRKDVIRAWDGYPIDEFNRLYRHIAETPPFTTVDVIVFRDGHELTIPVTVGDLTELDR
jgi:S1-C subfamily serine protease